MINNIEEALYHYRRLLTLMEEDYALMARNASGEFVQPYQQTIRKEMDQLQDMIRKLQII